jgi:hypothetical protein
MNFLLKLSGNKIEVKNWTQQCYIFKATTGSIFMMEQKEYHFIWHPSIN